MKQYSQRISIFWAITYFFTSSLAFAHTGNETHGSLSGFTHPFSGFDHWVAMVAVGLWAVQSGGRAIWVVPLSFVSVMAASGLLSLFIAPIPFIEGGIALSILILGLLIATSIRLSIWASTTLVGMFALFHGFAHGSEMPQDTDTSTYLLGFMTSTVLLHLVGVGIGLASERLGHIQWLRYSGTIIIVCGSITLINI